MAKIFFVLFYKKGLTRVKRYDIISESQAGFLMSVASAGVAELADARDLKSRDTKVSYRFETGHRHHTKFHIIAG